MALSIPQIRPGAYVEDVFDSGGKPKKIRRRGYITKVDYPGGAAYSAVAVTGVHVQFEEGKPPEIVDPSCLALIRGYDATAAARIRRDNDNAIGSELVKDVRPVAVDRTGVETTRKISEHDLKKYGLKT